MKLHRRDQRKIFMRSLLLQSAWDYERMQGLGFAWCMEPWLKRLYPHGGSELTQVRQREMDYFSTNPYMAGIVLGATARMEGSAASDPNPALEDEINRTRKFMGATLAGIGDPFFWGIWRPLCAVLAMLIALVLPASPKSSIISAIVIYLILYNTLPAWIRWNGIRWGYEFGGKIADPLKRLGFHKNLRRIRLYGFVLAVSLAAVAVLRAGDHGLAPAAIRVAVLLLCLAIKRTGWNALQTYMGLIMVGTLWVLAAGAPQ